MNNKHIYIFNGPSKSGKSDLARLINRTDSTVIIDDFIIPDNKNIIIDELNNRIPKFKDVCHYTYDPIANKMHSHLILDNIFIITNSDEIDIQNLIKKLDESEEYKEYVISYLEFKKGWLFL